MKKLIFTFLLFSLSLLVFAETTDTENLVINTNTIVTDTQEAKFNALSPEGKETFLLNRLVVEPYGKTEGKTIGSGYTNFGNFGSYSIYSGTTYAESATDWRPHKGYYQIPKVDFYDMVGATDMRNMWLQTKRAIDHRYKVFMSVGGSLVGVGGVMAIIGIILNAKMAGTPIGNTLFPIFYGTGLAMIIAGTTTMLCWKVNAPKYPNINVQLAIGLANRYNDNLIDKIANKSFI